MAYGPFDNPEQFGDFIDAADVDGPCSAFAIVDATSGRAEGMGQLRPVWNRRSGRSKSAA